MSDTLDRELQTAIEIARRAGTILQEVYSGDFTVAYKTKSDPVTEADTRANVYIVEALRDAFPDDGIVAEETDDQSDALLAGRCWYVDPVDGTREFVARNGEFAVMIGLAINGSATLGVVYQPEGDKLYAGVLGGPAFVEHGGHRHPLSLGQTPGPGELTLVVSRSIRRESLERLMGVLDADAATKMGSVGLKVGLIAEGAADLYVNMSSKTSAWDTCGPEAILRAAGGKMTDLEGRAFEYGGRDLRNRQGILAATDQAFDRALPMVERMAREVGLIG